MSVSYGGDSITFADNSKISSGWTGMKNRIINGAMMIDQRYAGSANTPTNGVYTADRWNTDKNSSLSMTIQQVDDGPTGFQKSLKLTVPSGSIGSTDYFGVRQVIENCNFYDIGSTWGTANPLSFTVSFWVKSSLAGTYYFTPRIPSVAHACYPYTIDQANTWEYKTITVTGPTNFTPLTQTTMNAGSFISVRFWVLAGSSESGATNGVWGNAGAVGVGMANLAASGGTWQITGVQVEKGSTASSFEYRPYGTELALCMRYCQPLTLPYGALAKNRTSSLAIIPFQVTTPMRTAPSFTADNIGSWWAYYDGSNISLTSYNTFVTSSNAAGGFVGGGLLTNGTSLNTTNVFFFADSSTTRLGILSAEL